MSSLRPGREQRGRVMKIAGVEVLERQGDESRPSRYA